jgi:hypothetical protein
MRIVRSAIAATLIAASGAALAADPARHPAGLQELRMIACLSAPAPPARHFRQRQGSRGGPHNKTNRRMARSWPSWYGKQAPTSGRSDRPRRFRHAEFMVKDAKKYEATGGWGFARWLGKDQKPYGKDANFVQECFGCHQPVKDRDWVFTEPAPLP